MTKSLLKQKVDVLADLVRCLEDDRFPQPEDYVQALRMIAETANSALPDAVSVMRGRGASWDEVGRWLEVSRQAAQQRFGAR